MQSHPLTVLHIRSQGIQQAMVEWGDVMLAQYGREREAYKRDYTLNTLGYSTDNGRLGGARRGVQ